MSQTPEQQAQVEQWRESCRADFERDILAKLGRSLGKKHDLWCGTHYYNALTNSQWETYLAGREAQQKVCAEEIERLNAAFETAHSHAGANGTAFRKAQARIAELEAAAKVGEPMAWRAYGAGHWNDGLPNASSVGYYGSAIEYAYAQQPAAQVPDEVPADAWGRARTMDYASGWNDCRATMRATHKESK